MERYIFLDYDGVLHDSTVFCTPERGPYMDTPGRTLFEWMPLLEQILVPYTDVKLILSTNWCSRLPGKAEEASSYLSAALQARVVGSTASDRNMLPDTRSRGEQIVDSARARGILDEWWIAIDDDAFRWPPEFLDRLVKTNGATGLSDPVVRQKLRYLLARYEF